MTNWYTLGIHLKLTVSTLDRIQDDFRDGQRAKEKMLEFGLEQDPGSTVPGSAATWKALVKAPRVMDENRVAKTIEEDVSHTLLNPNNMFSCLFSMLYSFFSTLKPSKNNVLMMWRI